MWFINATTFGQNDTDTFRMKLALGLHNPIDDGENDGYYSKRFNSPTIDFGFQYLFSRTVRELNLILASTELQVLTKSSMFKLNYSRINMQIVYDFTNFLNILPENFYSQVHFGPGISFTKPLANDSDNRYSFINISAGMEDFVQYYQKILSDLRCELCEDQREGKISIPAKLMVTLLKEI